MITAAEWQAINRQRAEVYEWFGSLFALEQTEDQLAHYKGDHLSGLYDLFIRLGLNDEVLRFQEAVNTLLEDANPTLELAADFAEHFLLDEKVSVLPYASFYLEEGKIYGDIEGKMSAFLKDNALAVTANFKEPADHLAVYLYMMNHWIKRADDYDQYVKISEDQATFLKNGLMSWLPLFVMASQELRLKYDVYPALTGLLLAFVEVDLEFLSEF